MRNQIPWSIRAALATLVLGALGFCAAAQAEPKLSKADMKYKNVYLEPFKVGASGVEETNPGPALAAAQQACLGALQSSGLFDTVKVGPAPKGAAGLVVKAELATLRIVGGTARHWAGAMAGKSEMKFFVTLIDAKTGEDLGKNAVGQDTNAFGAAWRVGPSDDSVPGRAGEAVAENIVYNAYMGAK